MANGAQDGPVFELGLVMAGAVSAGAYTAGAVDFLLEALEALDKAQAEGGDDAPKHRVLIQAMVGSSAGGMVAAMLASLARWDIEHADQFGLEKSTEENPLHAVWVKQADINIMTKLNDMKFRKPLPSVLNSRGFHDLVSDAVKDRQQRIDLRRRCRRRHFAPDMRLRLTTTNLRGIPFGASMFSTLPPGVAPPEHAMTRHADYVEFTLGDQGVAGAYTLDPGSLDDPAWARLRSVALATGAFPIGFAPIEVPAHRSDYDGRTYLSGEGPVQLPPRWGGRRLSTPTTRWMAGR